MYNGGYMAGGLPTGPATPDNTQNQQETRAERRRRRPELARTATTRERTASPETRTQATAVAETDVSEVGSGLLGQVARFPIAPVRGTARLGWSATQFGGRFITGPVKYPAMGAGTTVLAGGFGIGAALGGAYMLGKKIWEHGNTTYKSRGFFDSTLNNFKMTQSHFGLNKKK